MRRVGHGRKRSCREGGGRHQLLHFRRQLLRQVAIVHPGGLSPRPRAVPLEAHQPQGRRRSGLGAYQLGRGLRHHGREVRRDHGQVRRRGHHDDVGHEPLLVHGRLRRVPAFVPQPQPRDALSGMQGPASLRHAYELGLRLQLAGHGGSAGGHGALGWLHRDVELR